MNKLALAFFLLITSSSFALDNKAMEGCLQNTSVKISYVKLDLALEEVADSLDSEVLSTMMDRAMIKVKSLEGCSQAAVFFEDLSDRVNLVKNSISALKNI